METKKTEQIIRIKDLLFSALYQWRTIVIVMVALALLLGGFIAYSGSQGNEAEQQVYATKLAEYQLSLETLTAKENLLEHTLSAQQEYLNTSVYMNLDPYAYYAATLNLYVDTGYQVLPDHSYQTPDKTPAVLAAYETAFCNKETTQQIATIFSTQPQYAAELISCTYTSSTGSFAVTVRCTTAEQAEAVLKALETQLSAITASVNESIVYHEVIVLNKSVTCKADPNISVKRSEVADTLTTMQSALIDTRTQLASLVAPVEVVKSPTAAIKQAVIFAVIGAVLGMGLCVFIIWILHIISDKVFSAQALRDRTGVKVLCCACTNGSKNRRLKQKEGRCANSIDEQAAFMAAVIVNRYPEAKKILITGSVNADLQDAIAKALQAAASEKQFSCANNLCANAEAQTALAECDAAVLVAQCGVSRYDAVSAEAEIVTEHNKTLIGCVVLDG